MCNHIGTAVFKLPNYISTNRTVSEITHDGDAGDRMEMSSIYHSDGSINISYHPSWNKGMLDSYKKLVNNERSSLGLGRGEKDLSEAKS